VWARVVHTLTERIVPRPPIGEPQAVVWDTRVFTTDRQLKAFLDAKGISYAEWVSRHPAAFALLRHELPASAIAGGRGTVPARRKPKATAAKAVRVVSAGTPSSTTAEPQLLTALFVALGLALGASAVLPIAIAPRSLRRLYQTPERRVIALAAAAALLVGASLAALNL
jgi:hypothetical protein